MGTSLPDTLNQYDPRIKLSHFHLDESVLGGVSGRAGGAGRRSVNGQVAGVAGGGERQVGAALCRHLAQFEHAADPSALRSPAGCLQVQSVSIEDAYGGDGGSGSVGSSSKSGSGGGKGIGVSGTIDHMVDLAGAVAASLKRQPQQKQPPQPQQPQQGDSQQQ